MENDDPELRERAVLQTKVSNWLPIAGLYTACKYDGSLTGFFHGTNTAFLPPPEVTMFCLGLDAMGTVNGQQPIPRVCS